MTHDHLIFRDRNAISLWLMACLLLVASMVILGGYTRLSGSGLSITQWKPVHGTVPPLNASEWQEEFDAYKQSPQFQKVNPDMTVEIFKTIYWPEYFHRLLGRAIGMVFLLPWLVFALRRSFSRPFALRLLGIFALGGLQGLIGWLMVKSGLIDDPQVSHLRLALHLSVAFVIFGLLLWSLMGVASCKLRVASDTLLATRNSFLATYLFWFTALCLQILLGALVAGLHAGLVYNTWPDMNGMLLPPELTAPAPLENPVLMQFLHRILAIIVVLGFAFWWYSQRLYVKNNGLNGLATGIAGVLFLQFSLGVLTLLHLVPLKLALAHQAGALLLFALAVILLYRLRAS